MTGFPTSQVLYDTDGSGSFATDITALVLTSSQVTVSGYGRGDEFSQAQGAQLSLTLDDSDNAVTTETSSLGFGMVPFGSGGFGSPSSIVTPGRRVRFIETLGATTRTRFTGRIVAMDLGWPGGGQAQATVGVTATDVLADLARRPMRSMLEEEILQRVPASYYTLGEAEGSTSAGDSSYNQALPLALAGSGPAPTFGTGIGPVDGLTATQFFGGQYLASTGSPNTVGTAVAPFTNSTYSVVAEFATTTAPSGATALAVIAYARGWGLAVNSTGQLVATFAGASTVASTRVVTDGLTHAAAVTSNGTTVTLYLDGAAVASAAYPGSSALYDYVTVGGGAASPSVTTAQSFTGTVSHVAGFASTLIPASTLAIYQVSIGLAESTTARLARIAAYAGVSSSLAGTSTQQVGAQATGGGSTLDALMTVAAAEGGVLYADGTGALVLQSRGYRASKVAVDLTVTADEITGGTNVTYDTQQVFNQVTATRTNGAAQTATNPASITAYGLYATSLDLPVLLDSDALAAAQWLVASHAAPSKRLGSATFDLLTSPNAEVIFARSIGDRILITPLPSQAWAGSGDVVIEGWTEVRTQDSWTLTANLLPWSLFKAAIWGNAGSLWGTAVWAQ